MQTPADLRERSRLARQAAQKEADPEAKQIFARRALGLALLAQKVEREETDCMGELPLLWKESFSVGHADLDAQHRRMVEMINDIAAEVRSKKGPERLAVKLKMLRAEAEEHIRQENAVLWEIKSGTYEPLRGRSKSQRFLTAMADAAFDEHLREHAALLLRFNALGGAPVDKLIEMLKTWFVDHAITHDSHLKAIFQAM